MTARKCTCGAPATHNIVLGKVWFSVKSWAVPEYCYPCAMAEVETRNRTWHRLRKPEP